MQKELKAVQAAQYLRPLLRSAVPSLEIRVHSRVFLAGYKGCTNARYILSRSYGHEEFKNVNPFSVQKTHKAVGRSIYPSPAAQYSAVNENSRKFATLLSSVQRLH